MSEFDHIFRKNIQDKLSGHETPVDPSVWAAVQSSASVGAGAGSSAAGGFFSGIIGKVIIGAVIVAASITGVVLLNTSDKPTPSKTETTNEVANAKEQPEETSEKENTIEPASKQEEAEIEQPQFTQNESENSQVAQDDIAIANQETEEQSTPTQNPTMEPGDQQNEQPKQANPTKPSVSMDRGGSNEQTVDSSAPEANFSAFPDPYDPLTFEFIASMEGAQRYDWTVDGSASHSGQEVEVEFEEYGEHTVKLVVMDKYGRTKISTQTIQVIAECEFEMPTVFTPNGDNLNPLFEPKSISDGMKLLSIEVFTYGGEPVYFGDESPEFWVGRKMNGDEAQIGLYAYSISFKCLDGNVVTKQGNVQLNR